MEKQFKDIKDIDEVTKKWVKEAGLQQPSPQVLQNIMKTVEKKPYQPLINFRGWVLVAALFVLCMGLLYFYPIDMPFQMANGYSLPSINVSNITIYAVGFLVLFLIQVPFLKHIWIKEHQQKTLKS